MTYHVKQVSLPAERLEHLRGAELDTPIPGARSNLHVLHIIGWVVGSESEARAIEVVHEGAVIRVAPVRGLRPDVIRAIGDIPAGTQCNFHALIGLLGLEAETELLLYVVLADDSRVLFARIAVSRTPVQIDYPPGLRPLMLTCLGRTGSTWVMKLLMAHDQVVVYRRFPYESAPAKYWLHMLRVLSEPGNLMESARPDDFHKELYWVGKNPYWDESVFEQPDLATFSAETYVERLASFCQRSIDDWYLTLARSQGQQTPVYFAEKHMSPTFVPAVTWELYPDAREVFLVRDFRDMASSIFAFDDKRGFTGFGRPPGLTDEEYLVGDLRKMALDFRQSWLARRDRAHLLRYEDLVFRPRETLRSLLDYLGLDRSSSTIDEMLEAGAKPVPDLPGTSFDPTMVSQHRTSNDPHSSIGRWRNERDSAFRDLCNDAFGEALADFGYSESGPLQAVS